MTPTENLYYAIGQLAYAIAKADGKVQQEERKKFMDIFTELAGEKDGAVVSQIIFKLLDKQQSFDTETAYKVAMNTIRTNSHYLSPEIKARSIRVLEKVAEAFPPLTGEEKKMIDQFKTDIEPMNGDPVYYSPH